MDQLRSNLSKMDQNGSNLDFSPIETCHYKKLTYIMRINMVKLFGSDQKKYVQNGSNLIKFGFLAYQKKFKKCSLSQSMSPSPSLSGLSSLSKFIIFVRKPRIILFNLVLSSPILNKKIMTFSITKL